MLLSKACYRKMLLPVLAFALLPACSTTKKTACPPDVMCTMMFAAVGVQVTDAAGRPVQLDETYTMRAGTKEIIRPEQQPGAGHYIVLDDGYRKKLQQTSAVFRFVGKRNGATVVDQEYTIGADCCHISKVSGPDTLVVR